MMLQNADPVAAPGREEALQRLQAQCERQARDLGELVASQRESAQAQRGAADGLQLLREQLQDHAAELREGLGMAWDHADEQAHRVHALEERLGELAAAKGAAGGAELEAGKGAEAWRAAQERTQAKLRNRQVQLESAIMQVSSSAVKSFAIVLCASHGVHTCMHLDDRARAWYSAAL